MTDDSALAALAIQVTALKGNLSKLRGDLDAARHEFAEQLAEVAAQLEDLAAREGKSLAAIYWPGLDEAARSAALEVLSAWVNQMRQWHPGYFAVVAECWPGHPEAVAELSNVMGEHTRIYQRDKPPLADALVFYDRWLPGMLRRLAEVMRACGPAGCSKRVPAPVRIVKCWSPRARRNVSEQGHGSGAADCRRSASSLRRWVTTIRRPSRMSRAVSLRRVDLDRCVLPSRLGVFRVFPVSACPATSRAQIRAQIGFLRCSVKRLAASAVQLSSKKSSSTRLIT